MIFQTLQFVESLFSTMWKRLFKVYVDDHHSEGLHAFIFFFNLLSCLTVVSHMGPLLFLLLIHTFSVLFLKLK